MKKISLFACPFPQFSPMFSFLVRLNEEKLQSELMKRRYDDDKRRSNLPAGPEPDDRPFAKVEKGSIRQTNLYRMTTSAAVGR